MSQRAPLACLVLLLAAYVAWGGLYILRTGFTIDGESVFLLWDDAMISMQYARNLARGDGLVYNAGGEAVQGITNPGLSLVMAALHLFPVSAEKMSLVVQLMHLLVLTALLLSVYFLARRLFPESAWIALGAGVATALCAPHSVWSLQGAEVGWVGLWLLGLVAALALPASARQTTLLAALISLGLLLRWDSAIFAGTGVLIWLTLPGDRRRRLLVGGGSITAVLGAMMLASWAYYGDALPNTYYLKATGSARTLVLEHGLGRFLDDLPQLGLSLALAGVSIARRRRSPAVLAAASFCVVALAYNVWVGGDWAVGYGSRFVVPTFPLLLMLAVDGAWQLLRSAVPDAAAFATPALGLLAAACLGIATSPVESRAEWLDPEVQPMFQNSNIKQYRYARYVAEHTDPSTVIGVHWAGIPAYFSGRTAVDLLGKSDRHIARLEVDRFHPGHSKWDWDYVVNDRRPDLLMGESRGLLHRRDFRDAYQQLDAPGGLRMFLRKDASHKLDDPAARLSAIPENAEIRTLAAQLFRRPEAAGFVRLARLHEREGEHALSCEALRRALRLDREAPEISAELARCLEHHAPATAGGNDAPE